MTEIELIQRIKSMCQERNWSYYQLSKSSGLPYSTISTLMNHHGKPSFITLCKICDGFGISISDFFAPGRDTETFSPQQKECLTLFNSMSAREKEIALAFMKGLVVKSD